MLGRTRFGVSELPKPSPGLGLKACAPARHRVRFQETHTRLADPPTSKAGRLRRTHLLRDRLIGSRVPTDPDESEGLMSTLFQTVPRVVGGQPRFLALAMCGALAFLAGGTSLFAQGESNQGKHLTIRKIEPIRKDGSWSIKVSGKNECVPAGTNVEVHVMFRSSSLQVLKMKAGTPGALFEEVFKLKSMPVTQDEFQLTTIIRLEKQRGKLEA